MAAKRKSTKYEQDSDTKLWSFHTTHPDGHEATGSGYESKDDAKKAAGSVVFGE